MTPAKLTEYIIICQGSYLLFSFCLEVLFFKVRCKNTCIFEQFKMNQGSRIYFQKTMKLKSTWVSQCSSPSVCPAARNNQWYDKPMRHITVREIHFCGDVCTKRRIRRASLSISLSIARLSLSTYISSTPGCECS